MFHWKRVALTTTLVALAACGGSSDCSITGGQNTQPTTPTNPGTTNPGSVSTNSVTVASASFDPSNITVAVGSTVNWTWNSCSDDGYGGSNTCVSHAITFDDGSGIASATQSSGTFSRTFQAAGTYKYHCAIHGQAMSGQIIVK
jgi:plastocyanin